MPQNFSLDSNLHTAKLHSLGKGEIFFPFMSGSINLLIQGLSYLSTEWCE